MNPALFDLSPLLRLAGLGLLLASGPLLWLHLRQRHAAPSARLRALTWLTLFLCFDLVLFGAFTRLSDSGLGCPDWPGCYGNASPLGATLEIHAAQAQMPSGPVTHGKAWVEMVHRYLATTVGVLILVLCALSWRLARAQASPTQPAPSPWWPTFTLLWVCLQGAFGALTVTMKLFPLIVTLHLLGGLGLLMLLAVQTQAYEPKRLHLSPALRRGVGLVLVLCLLQISLGGWVSTNYAVLACSDFPSCQGQWWPAMDFAQGFTLWRGLGLAHDGQWLPFTALTAIHMAHRLGAVVALAALLVLAWRLQRSAQPEARPWAQRLVLIAAWQAASGLSNVVLGWPLLSALAHTGGAAALLICLSLMLARISHGRRAVAPPV
jgi:cytochrome c oxidase assembly protein subunit 15